MASLIRSLKTLNAPTIASVVMKEAIKRANIEPGAIDDVRFGSELSMAVALEMM